MNTIHIETNPATAGPYASLHARQAELLARLADVQRATLDLANGREEREATDFKEGAERAELERVGDAQAERDHAELVEVRAAIARLQDGDYGVCVACADPIDAHRLQARPSAIRCTACQAAYEALAARMHGVT
jgi:DnaK suppressor protein